MPNGFWYAGGETHVIESSIPSSAFSKGDILAFTSTSSISRASEVFVAGENYAGVALSDSVDSLNDQVPYLVPGQDTLFWGSLQSADATALTPGLHCDIGFDVAEGRYFVDPSSTNSLRAVIIRGNAGVGSVDQSVQSKVLCRLIHVAGDRDFE